MPKLIVEGVFKRSFSEVQVFFIFVHLKESLVRRINIIIYRRLFCFSESDTQLFRNQNRKKVYGG